MKTPTTAFPSISLKIIGFWFLKWNLKTIDGFEEKGPLNIVCFPLPFKQIVGGLLAISNCVREKLMDLSQWFRNQTFFLQRDHWLSRMFVLNQEARKRERVLRNLPSLLPPRTLSCLFETNIKLSQSGSHSEWAYKLAGPFSTLQGER